MLVTLIFQQDRTKVCAALEDKVDDERVILTRLEDDLKNEHNHHMEVWHVLLRNSSYVLYLVCI